MAVKAFWTRLCSYNKELRIPIDFLRCESLIKGREVWILSNKYVLLMKTC